jgi:2',3'-cyclic-nucleotide 2'-phosphodiesterase (5'-nucleotidase family)
MLNWKRLGVLLVIVSLVGVFWLASAQDTYTLQVLHSSDNETAFQDPNTLEPKILNFAAVVAGLQAVAEAEGISSIHVTAGDHTLPGPFYEAATEVESLGANGLADIAFYNAMGLNANGIGNHEFDGGINDFATMLAAAAYPFIAVNLDFSAVQLAEGTPAIQIGEDGGNAADNAGKVVKSAWVEAGGEKIGLIGRAPAGFFEVINDPDETLPGLDFVGGRNEENRPLISAVGMVLEQVDLLEAQGVNKIILLDHAQDFTSDPLSTSEMRGIDIIVSAGSTGFMGGEMAMGPFNMLREGDEANAEYPTAREDSEGNPVVVVNTDQLYSYVGNLIVTFDADGVIASVDERSGPVASTEAAVDALSEYLGSEVSVPAAVQETYDALQATDLIQGLFEVVGTTNGELNGLRANVRSRETNLGSLAADSALWFANEMVGPTDIALKNGGGIRATILGPNVTRLTINSALAFNNNMVVVELTGGEVIAMMENALSRNPSLDGRFPQVAGMYVEFDSSREGISDAVSLDAPSRVQTLHITRADGSEDVLVADNAAVGDLSRTFMLVTNNFLLRGGDGYQVLAAASEARGFADPGVGERQILTDYIVQVLGGVVDNPEPIMDARIVKLNEEE